MSSTRKKYLFWGAGLTLVLASVLFFGTKGSSSVNVPVTPTVVNTSRAPTRTPARVPKTIPLANGPLKDSIIAAGDYLVRQQLPNGELSYQVDFTTGKRLYSPSHIRLIAGTGSLYTVCRVSGASKYCDAGDLALKHYLEQLVSDPKKFKGTCLYAEGACQLGGAALTVDAVYKRWQATGDFLLKDRNLLGDAMNLGYFIVSMRRPEGGFYHSYDPHFGGAVDANFYMTNFTGESLLALAELYEMTGNKFWLTQAREVNAYMITQPVTEDHWHSYALGKLALLDSLSKADKAYGEQIANVVIAGGVRSLNPKNTSASTATKIEALASLAQAFYLSGAKHEWLDPKIRAFIIFVHARQLPENNCGWTISAEMIKNFGGGVFSGCDEASIRIDGVQNWINGATAYLEYQGMIKK